MNLPLQASVVDPVQRRLILIRIEHDRRIKLGPAAHRNQHKNMQRIRAQLQRQLVRLIQLAVIMLGDGGVDLHRHSDAAEVLESRDGFVEGTPAPELVVGGCIRAIEAAAVAARVAAWPPLPAEQ